MKFGYFEDSSREYVINIPNTPYPWINYLGNEDFYSLISNTSGGYCFYKDAKMLRLTRYRYNSVPCDNGGRYFYINEKGTIWTPGFLPAKTKLDHYECRHGMGYTTIKSSLNNLSVAQTTFVPIGSNAEVTRLKFKNNSSEIKTFTTFSFVEFCLWNAYDDMTNFQRNYSIGEVEVIGSAIYHKTEYRERRNHYAVFAVNAPIDGFDTDRETFIGLYNGFDCPDVVTAGQAQNSVASGWAPIGSHAINITLNPGEEKSYIYVLGYCENAKDKKWEAPNVINKKPARKLIESFKTDEQVDAALSELAKYWDTLLSNYQLKSSDPQLNRMVNIWNQYQCMVTFNMSRSASYFESGIGRGMGFRDSTQDLLGFVHLIPSRAKDRILDIAATQWEDGSAYHQYQPLTKKGNMDIGSGFNDDPLWLIFGVAAYIKETDDWDILNEQVAFDSNENNKASLLEHLKRSFRHVTNNLGPHGLPLIGRADWNDCLNLNCFSETPGDSFQTCSNFDSGIAESVFIAGMFVYIGKDYMTLCEHFGWTDESNFAKAELNKMYDNVLTHGWDGDWFIRAYDAYGQKVGSHECKEAQIFIEPQGFCIMGGIGIKEGLAERALKSVSERLDTKYGIVLLNPPYETYHLNLGEVSSYPPGYKENAGIFCHNNPWVTIAETKLGHGNRAFEIYKKTCPAYLEDISDIHRTEPYVYSQMIAGKDAVRFGEAKNSWLTGTAAWSFYSISQDILGIKPDYNGLLIDPCIPEDIEEYTVTRKFRGDTYIIHIDNSAKISKGVKSILVDGKAIDGNIIAVIGDGAIHTVEVILGN